MCQKYGFLSFARYLSYKFVKKLLNAASKTGLDTRKTAYKKYSIQKLNQQENLYKIRLLKKLWNQNHANSKNVKEIIPPQKKQEILNEVFFKHFASKNQQPSFYISQTLVKNGLKCQF